MPRKRSKSERSKLIEKRRIGFRRVRRKSERSLELKPEENTLNMLCNTVDSFCFSLSTLISQCLMKSSTNRSKVISLFEATWANVFDFDALSYALENKTEKVESVSPRGLSYPTNSDIFSLVTRLSQITDTFIDSVKSVQPSTFKKEDLKQSTLTNLAEFNKYLRGLTPLLRNIFPDFEIQSD